MSSVTFILKEPKSKKPTLVYLFFRFNNQTLKFSTGQKINPLFWKGKVRETIQFSEHEEFNTLLENLESCVKNTYRKLLNDRITPTHKLIKKSIDEFLKRNSGNSNDLVSFGEYLISNTDRKESTKKQLSQTIRKLKEFKKLTNTCLQFEAIDLEFYDSFVDFLIKKDLSKNTIGSLIKNIKVFMNEAFDRKLTTNLQFKNKRFKTLEESSENIYLSESEINKLYSLDLSDNGRLEKVRDLFVIACYTGLRFSDLVQLRNENFNHEGNQVKITTQKTNEVVIIPLKKCIKEILNKYNGLPPQLISNQKMNDYLKELGEIGKINEDILKTSTKGAKRKTESFKKWELITTHTARRSFATNAYLQSVPSISIMKITGHRTEKSFLKYIKISQQDNANKLINHPFFN